VPDLLLYVSPAVVVLGGLAYRWLYLRFIWRVYRKGGAKDVVAIAAALRGLCVEPPDAGPGADESGSR
jgi:hypothetical protein